jgi:hypothetical protein
MCGYPENKNPPKAGSILAPVQIFNAIPKSPIYHRKKDAYANANILLFRRK